MNQLPLQPLYTDEHGTRRFRANSIVTFLLDSGPFDMNSLARMDFSNDEREQFAQLIGYSLSGFAELSYVSDDTYGVAEHYSNDENLVDARLHYYSETLEKLRKDLRQPMAELFGVHPDDLNK